MTKHTIETVTFRLNENVSKEAFIEAAGAINTFVGKRSGFISRRLSCSDDGLWIEHIEWKTLADAQSAASEIGNEASLTPCMAAIDVSTVTMHHTTLEITKN